MVRPSAGPASLIGVLAGGLIAGAVIAGLRLPAEVALDGFPARTPLDYDASFRSGVAPLRQGFVDEVLGRRAGTTPLGAASPVHRDGTPRLDSSDPFAQSRNVVTHPFLNDDRNDAQVVGSIPFTGRTDASSATRESGEPDPCSSNGGTAWYRYRSTADEALIANTFGTTYALSIAVYKDAGTGSPVFEDCDADLAGNALVQFRAERNVAYLFQIAARTTGGRLVFNLEPGGSTELASVKQSGEAARGLSQLPSISADGRWVAFESNAPGVSDDTPDRICANVPEATMSPETGTSVDSITRCLHVYLRDRVSGRTQLVSKATDGSAGNNTSQSASVSADGRFVAFISSATNLAATDTNDDSDVFVRDMLAGVTEQVSHSSAAASSVDYLDRGGVSWPSISDDGRFIAFVSSDPGHVPGDTNDIADVFVWDRVARRMERVSVSSAEEQAERRGDTDPILRASVSADGRYVVFTSPASDLVRGDTNDVVDVFVRDRLNGTTEIVSVSNAGSAGNDAATDSTPAISGDGRYIVFGSGATNLVRDDHNGVDDVFVRDRLLRTTFRASVSSAGVESDRRVYDGTISGNGRYVAFASTATNLAPGSRNAAGGQTCNDLPLYGSCPEDLYVHDIVTRTTTRIPVAPSAEFEGSTRSVSISHDGGVLAFYSGCLECLNTTEVWVHDRRRRPV